MSTNSAASRFVGRPAKLCRKCKSAEYIVNQFGGIECSRCTKEQGEFPRLYVVAGEFSDQPDEWNTGATQETQEESAEAWNGYDEIFEMNLPRTKKIAAERTWSDVDVELAELVEWYRENRLLLPTEGPMDFHIPGRKARGLKDMQYQLSPKIYNPAKFYAVLDIEVNVQGVNGPRVMCGTLKADLRRLREITS